MSKLFRNLALLGIASSLLVGGLAAPASASELAAVDPDGTVAAEDHGLEGRLE